MRKIFVYWIIFLLILIAGIILAVSSKLALKREENRAEKLRKSIISTPSRITEAATTPTAGEKAKEEAKEETQPAPPSSTELPSSAEIPSLQNIPVQINTNSLEIAIPAPSGESLSPAQDKKTEDASPAGEQ